MMTAHGSFRWILLLLTEFSAVICLIPHVNKYVNVINLIDRYLPYSSAWDLQRDLMQHHIHLQDKIDPSCDGAEQTCVGTVILCQHNPTYTLGSATTEGSGPFSKKLADGTVLEYDTFTVERAGQATFHGPGQLVVYPILDLSYFGKDIHLYLRALEETIMETLTVFDISSQRIEGKTLKQSLHDVFSLFAAALFLVLEGVFLITCYFTFLIKRSFHSLFGSEIDGFSSSVLDNKSNHYSVLLAFEIDQLGLTYSPITTHKYVCTYI